MNINKEVLNKINKLNNPYTNNSIDFKEFLVNMNVDEDKIIVEFRKLGDNEELNKIFNRELIRLLKVELKFMSVKIIHPSLDTSDEVSIDEQTKIIAFMSGKGGVGKSTCTVATARELVKQGFKVGIMDADIYGYSIPKLLNCYQIPLVENEQILPVISKEGIEVISAQFFIEDNKNEAIIWRSSMLNQMMKHFFNDVKWSRKLDYLLIDLPPGTGDVTLNINTFVDNVNAILVTTPHKDAAHVALRSGQLAKELNFNTIGIIENMSYYQHENEKLFIFGKGGASEISSELDIPIICNIPINENLEFDYKEVVSHIQKYT